MRSKPTYPRTCRRISSWTTMGPTKPLSSGSGLPNAPASTCTSPPPTRPGSTWWNAGSPRLPISEFDAACSAVCKSWKPPSANTSMRITKIPNPSRGRKRRIKSSPASPALPSARAPSHPLDLHHEPLGQETRVRTRVGRKPTPKEVRELIFRMVVENPTWGAPRIHGELLMLGFDLCERTISRWMRRAPRDPEPAQRWLTFLRNHREAIAAMDFFAAPTLTFGVLYCFFVIGHDRRKILRFNVTRNPSALWIVQQMRQAWPYTPGHRFLLFDRDSKFGDDVVSFVKEMGSRPIRTAFRSPWQNGVAERWVGSCRR